MLSLIATYLPMVLIVIGAASTCAAGLAPLVKSEAMKARLGKLMKVLELLHGLLGRAALNPKAPK